MDSDLRKQHITIEMTYEDYIETLKIIERYQKIRDKARQNKNPGPTSKARLAPPKLNVIRPIGPVNLLPA